MPSAGSDAHYCRPAAPLEPAEAGGPCAGTFGRFGDPLIRIKYGHARESTMGCTCERRDGAHQSFSEVDSGKFIPDYSIRHHSMGKTPEQISYNMSRIRSKDTGIELKLRKELWSRGLRYRKNARSVYGNPDIVFKGKKVAVFCDSEFWHGRDWETRKFDFKSNEDRWIAKIERNMERDRQVTAVLETDGWTVLRFWGKDIDKKAADCADEVEKAVRK